MDDNQIFQKYITTQYGKIHDFDSELKTVRRLYRRNFLPLMSKDRGVKILDLGCGMGHLLYFLEQEGYKNYLGVDVSQETIEFCQKRGFKVVQQSIAEYLKQSTETFDHIFMIDVLEHITIDEAVDILKMAHEHLKPGGNMIVIVPNAANPIVGTAGIYNDITHKFGYTQLSLPQIFSVAGFSKIRILPQDIYIYSYNPFNYLAMAAAFCINQIFRLLYLLYGKQWISIFSKSLIGVGEK